MSVNRRQFLKSCMLAIASVTIPMRLSHGDEIITLNPRLSHGRGLRVMLNNSKYGKHATAGDITKGGVVELSYNGKEFIIIDHAGNNK